MNETIAEKLAASRKREYTLTREDVLAIGDESQKRSGYVDLSGADLSGANLINANLINANLINANLSGADLSGADLSGANLINANLINANLGGTNLSGAYLINANLGGTNLSGADLRYANLRYANLRYANLRYADLRYADLRYADLSVSDLINANLGGALGLLNRAEWLRENVEFTPDGIVVFKTFGAIHPPPDHWTIEAGAYITEVSNLSPTCECACGVNISTALWLLRSSATTKCWRCLIEYPDLIAVTIPYNTNGKFRAERVKLLELISRAELETYAKNFSAIGDLA